MDNFLDANPARKMATRLFTVANLNRHNLSAVSNPDALWHVSERRKKAPLVKHHSNRGDAEWVPEEVSS